MAQATAYNMTSARGAREDLSDQLKRVEPQDTPLYSLLPQSSAPNAMLTEWNIDDLGAPNIKPVLDGTDLQFVGGSATSSAGSPGTAGDTGDFEFKFNNKVRAGNRIQQLRSGFTVSPMTEKIAIAGLASPYAEAKAKATLELKRSIEVMIGSNEKGAVQSGGTGDISAGLGQWSNPGNGAGTMWHSSGINTASANYRPVAGSRLVFGSGKTLTENDGSGNNLSFRSMLQKVYEASGIKASYRLFAGPAVINAISDFTRTNSGATRFNQETTGGGSISLSVVEYKSDYGVIQVVPDLFLFRSISAPSTLVSNSALLIPNDDNVSLKVMDGVTAVDLPDIGGGGKRGYVSFAGTTCVLNAKALGSISPS